MRPRTTFLLVARPRLSSRPYLRRRPLLCRRARAAPCAMPPASHLLLRSCSSRPCLRQRPLLMQARTRSPKRCAAKFPIAAQATQSLCCTIAEPAAVHAALRSASQPPRFRRGPEPGRASIPRMARLPRRAVMYNALMSGPWPSSSRGLHIAPRSRASSHARRPKTTFRTASPDRTPLSRAGALTRRRCAANAT